MEILMDFRASVFYVTAELFEDDQRLEDQGSPRAQQDLRQGWQEGRRRRVLENLQQGMGGGASVVPVYYIWLCLLVC